MNRLTRAVSSYPYYGYINRFSPQHIRQYQSQRNYKLGRRGAYDTLVMKMAADHISYQQDLNGRYKVPIFYTNLTMRCAMYWFWIPTIMILFMLGDMNRLFNPHTYSYPGKPGDDAMAPTRYQTMYFIDRVPRPFQ